MGDIGGVTGRGGPALEGRTWVWGMRGGCHTNCCPADPGFRDSLIFKIIFIKYNLQCKIVQLLVKGERFYRLKRNQSIVHF